MHNLFLIKINKSFYKMKIDNKHKLFYKNSKNILLAKGKL